MQRYGANVSMAPSWQDGFQNPLRINGGGQALYIFITEFANDIDHSDPDVNS